MRISILFFALTIGFGSANAQSTDPWVEYMTPSAVHALFTKYEGNFTMQVTMFMEEGKDPVQATVKSVNTMLLGGRFLEMKQHGDMMGMPYESLITIGFNNTDKQLTLTMLTNMGTGTLAVTGAWDAKTSSATLYGKITNPVSKNSMQIKQVLTFINPTSFTIDSYDQEGNQPAVKTIQYKFVKL